MDILILSTSLRLGGSLGRLRKFELPQKRHNMTISAWSARSRTGAAKAVTLVGSTWRYIA